MQADRNGSKSSEQCMPINWRTLTKYHAGPQATAVLQLTLHQHCPKCRCRVGCIQKPKDTQLAYKSGNMTLNTRKAESLNPCNSKGPHSRSDNTPPTAGSSAHSCKNLASSILQPFKLQASIKTHQHVRRWLGWYIHGTAQAAGRGT